MKWNAQLQESGPDYNLDFATQLLDARYHHKGCGDPGGH